MKLALTALICALPFSALLAAEPTLQLKDNDVWVMSGDSITAQRQHTNFIEAYYRTRLPNLHLHFRNSGIGGNRVSSILARFDYDVAAWKPTIVSVELGMNDVGSTVDVYIKDMRTLIGKIREIHAQPVLISSSPVDDGSIMGDWKGERCQKIDGFTVALKKLADEENVLMVDQYHALIDLWGQNRRKGAEAAAKKAALSPPPAATPVPPPATPTPDGKPVPPKPAPIPPSLIPLTGDTVHPGSVGQYTMAAAILKGWKASGEVSSATIKADGKVVEAKGCEITNATAKDGKLSFTRKDAVGPWPILPQAKPALELMPEILKLTEYTLKVTDLSDGSYKVSINGKLAATLTAKELAAGWNISSSTEGAIGERSTAILNLIGKLQSPLNNEWRAQSKAKDTEKLAAAQKAIEETETELQTLVQPVALQFEIAK